MAKSKLNFVLLLLLLMVAIVSVVCSSAFAEEGDSPVYIEADITLSNHSVYKTDNISANVKVWQSSDRINWESSSFVDNCSVKYFDAEGNLLSSAPTELGDYVVKIIVNSDYNGTAYYLTDKPITAGTVMSAYSYSIVNQNFAVLFYPGKDEVFSANIYEDIFSKTQPYYGGTEISSDKYTLSVSKLSIDTYVSVDKIDNPGSYKITLTLKEYYEDAGISADNCVFESYFNLYNSVAALVRIADDDIYEGMYSTPDTQALAAAYYTPKLEGTLVDQSDFSGKYVCKYKDGNSFSAIPPRTAGKHVCRISFTEAIPSYDFVAGDFIDLEYNILSVPYTVSYSLTGGENDDNNAVIVQNGAMSLITAFKDLFGNSLNFNPTLEYYIFNNDTSSFEQLSAGQKPQAKGRYKAKVIIDVSNDITGKEIFGYEHQKYCISNDNGNYVLEYYFQIVAKMQVNGLHPQYVYNGNTVSPSFTIEYSGAKVDPTLFSVSYFDEGGNAVTPINAGSYYGEILFSADWNVNETTLINAGDRYRFSFLITEPEIGISLSKNQAGTDLLVGFKDDVSASDYSVSYYRYKNNFNYAVSKNILLSEVGTYHVLFTFFADYKSLGIDNGDIILVNYENVAESNIDNISLSVNGSTFREGMFYIGYDGNIKPVVVQMGEAAPLDLNYTIYYESIDSNGVGTVCGYPIMPGKYRATLKFNAPTSFFNANCGDYCSLSYIINPIKLVGDFKVSDDLVFDKEQKEFTVSFKGNNRPLNIDSSNYTLRYAIEDKLQPLEFSLDSVINAGSYYIAAVFKNNNFREYGINYSSVSDYKQETIMGMSVFSSLVTIEKLALAVKVSIPVEEKGLYKLNGTEVLPTYTYYKSNSFGTFDLEVAKTLSPLPNINSSDFISVFHTGSLTSLVCDQYVEDATQTGRYVLSKQLSTAAAANMHFKYTAVEYDGGKQNVSYESSIFFASRIDDNNINIGYRISPLPLTIKASAAYDGELYYGAIYACEKDDLRFSTIDTETEGYPQKDLSYLNLQDHVSIRYYNRLSGQSTYIGSPIEENGTPELSSSYLFNTGDYTLKITFVSKDPTPEFYSHFTVSGGFDKTNAGVSGDIIEADDFFDIKYSVLAAKDLRVVFVRKFESFVTDGNKKEFDIRLFSGNDDVTAEIIPPSYTQFYKYCTSDSSDLDEAPSAKGSYSIKVTFSNRIYKYRINQLEGVYSHPEASYVVDNSIVTFSFTIRDPVNLSWSFISDNVVVDTTKALVHDYSGDSRSIDIRFYRNGYTDIPVNLIYNIDYAVWYYRKSSDGDVEKLLSAPTEAGDYIAEIIFLRSLFDYRVAYEGDFNRIPYGYIDAESKNLSFGKSLNSNKSMDLNQNYERRYLKYSIVPSKILVSGYYVEDKIFDNTANATIMGKPKLSVTDNGKIVQDSISDINKLLAKKMVVKFDSLVANDSVFATLYIDISTNENEVLLRMPQQRFLVGNTNGIDFIRASLVEMRTAAVTANDNQKVSDIDDFGKLLNDISKYYIISFPDFKAKISKASITVAPKAYTREYDPFYIESDRISYTIECELLKDIFLEDIFSGSLARVGERIENGVGAYPITIGSLAVKNTPYTLSDNSVSDFASNFTISFPNKNIFYTISRRKITLAVTVLDSDGKVSNAGLFKYYDQPDPQFGCTVSNGSLTSGDSLNYLGENAPVRESKSARDSVGKYLISLSNVKIYDDENVNVSDNYLFYYTTSYFEIQPREIWIQPISKEVDYGTDFTTVYDLDAEEKNYAILYSEDDVAPSAFVFPDGEYLAGHFGQQRVDDSSVEKYKITLGNLFVADATGRDITSNYTIIMAPNVKPYFTIKKVTVRFKLVNTEYSKVFGSPDPIITVELLTALPDGFEVAAGSSAERDAGEDVLPGTGETDAQYGSYMIKNKSSLIKILKSSTQKDVTSSFDISVEVGESKFTINPYELTVSVKPQTIIKEDGSINLEPIYRDSTTKSVSPDILALLKVKYIILSDNLQEGENIITPKAIPNANGEEPTDSNFIIKVDPGTVVIVFPQNHPSFYEINDDEEIVKVNEFVFADFKLFQTLQMFSTDNKEKPTREVTIVLPVSEKIQNKNIHVIAVREDGSYVPLDGKLVKDGIEITDTEFYCILICSVKTWPYYVLGALGVLLILAVVYFISRKIIRKKRRGGEKAKNYTIDEFAEEDKKAKKNKNQPNALPTAAMPNGGGNGGYDDIEDIIARNNVPANGKKKKKSNNDKPQSGKITLGGAVPGAKTPSAMPGAKAPSAAPAPLSSDFIPDIKSTTPNLDDEISISSPNRKGDDIVSAPSADSLPLPPEDDDDEIVISSSRQRFDD